MAAIKQFLALETRISAGDGVIQWNAYDLSRQRTKNTSTRSPECEIFQCLLRRLPSKHKIFV